MIRFLNWLEEKLRRNSKTPWCRFQTPGIEDGSVRYDMAWNKAFLENLRKAGFQGHNEQEIVEDFFLGSMIIPKAEALGALQSPPIEFDDPALTSTNNRFKK